MGYQAVLKQYKGSIPQKVEIWQLDAVKEEQWKEFDGIPCRLRCRKQEREGETHFLLEAEAAQNICLHISLALEYIPEIWNGEEYVFFPAAVYNGNKFQSLRLPYPPYHAGGAKGEPAITDIPHLDPDGKPSRIQFLSGDMSTPAMGYYDSKNAEGWLVFAKHLVYGMYTGFSVRQEEGAAGFSVSCPGVREETKYFFGDLPDGSGFYPTCDYPSEDTGIRLEAGERLELEACCYRIAASGLRGYFARFNDLRECMETGTAYESIPFSHAYGAVKEKYRKLNFSEEGYLRVGSENDQVPAFWQAGWVGGGMNTYPFLLEDDGEAYQQAISTLRFVTDHLQRPNGWYTPMYAKGVSYGDDFLGEGDAVLLVRKDADLLYFLLKQAMYLEERGELPEGLKESIRSQADAFVRFYRKNGELGQFLDMEKETLLQGGTGCGAMALAALSLAYEYFGTEAYRETAEALGDWYWENCLKQGMLNGGPGEICQAPDSESAFAFLESCVQLYETTGREKWLEAAREAFELAVTWVVSYDFAFPEGSTAGKLGVHTRGTVFANAQNKHSAPGICTLSGNSLLKLYRFTGDEKYLEWLKRISHALSQFVSLAERPVDTLAGKPLPPGYFNERVQTSDWEGTHTVGEFLYGSNWPEVSMLLTYVEVPGVYVDLERERVFCCDHVGAELIPGGQGRALRLKNTTPYDAVVTVFLDHAGNTKLGHSYFARMEKVPVRAGEECTVRIAG